MRKRSTHQEAVKIINTNGANNKFPKQMKQKTTEPKDETDNLTIIEKSKAPLSVINRTSRN